MSIDDLQEAIHKLQRVELRRAVHGVDATQARELLDEAADALAEAAREQTELRAELERLLEANDASAIGRALLAATHAGEALVAEAQETAGSITAEAEAEASALLGKLEKELESSRNEAEAALAHAREELDRLENEAVQLRTLVADMERRIREIAHGALAELEAFGASGGGTREGDLLDDLRPAPERSGQSEAAGGEHGVVRPGRNVNGMTVEHDSQAGGSTEAGP